MMNKIDFKEIKNRVSLCGLSTNLDELVLKPFFGVHHIHEWDHGYESYNGYNGTRREFYSDMRDMLSFLLDYAETNNISTAIVAPLFTQCQFSSMRAYPDKTKSLYKEIHEFLKNLNIRSDSRSGVEFTIKDNENIVEMVLEGAFLDDVSNLRIFFPDNSVIIDLNHHFDIAFFTTNFEKEKSTIMSILNRHPNLKYYERANN